MDAAHSQEAQHLEGPPKFGGEPGTPVPAVDPEDLKAIWRVYRDTELRHPGQRVAISMDSIARECKISADVQAVVYRIMMLQLIRHVAQEQLAPWTKGEELDEAVFIAASQIPMEWIGREERVGLPFDLDELLRRLRGEAA
jgi:hypothetical protein